MKAIELRNKYINFFERNGHVRIPGASLVPENDPTVLFTTAGMHPLISYLCGESHPAGKRLTSYQKCLRTGDIDEVGDECHLTFFEMLGNWSLGDYFKEESIKLSYKFLTEELNIPKEKISVTCFAGDETAPKDEEVAKVWNNLGIDNVRIFFFGKKENWWGPAGTTGPCGTDTEIFYDTGKEKCNENCNPSCSCGKYVEIWNNVFMQYNKEKDGTYTELKQKNVDTGLGLERVIYIFQGKKNVYETELFEDIIKHIEANSKNKNIESIRIIADHTRASVMLMQDKVEPSNVEHGYILRRLIRRVIRHMRKIGYDVNNISDLVNIVINVSSEMYPELIESKDNIIAGIVKEKNRFMNTLVNGENEFNKVVRLLKEEDKNIIDGPTLFRLYDTFGFPPELTNELAMEQNMTVDMEGFNTSFKEHQEKSRQGSDKKFKGGLADNSEETTKYHTATHLIHQALKNILGNHVEQRGANITEERIRFDFSNTGKVERETLDKVEEAVNEIISQEVPVVCEEMTLEEARQSGAHGLFENKYGDIVKVYTIGNFSKEICGGPHVDNTSKLDKIKIIKEEAVSSGVRRIKAVFVK